MNILVEIPYGSHLYGTATPESDYDFKRIYLPPLNDVLLGGKLQITQSKENARGEPIGPNTPMPADGREYSNIPVQVYWDDFVRGQTYAVEMAMEFTKAEYSDHPFYPINGELVSRFLTRNITPMVGFAAKQVWDYCKRGERLVVFQSILDQLVDLETLYGGATQLSRKIDGVTLMELIAGKQNLPMKAQEHNQISLEVNGRSYMANTTIMHLRGQIQKHVDRYGPRTTEASVEEIDWKSLSHAVRVYQQILELVETRGITFPRPNADYLLSVKQGRVDATVVRDELTSLDARVKVLEATSTLPNLSDIRDEFQEWKEWNIRQLYGVSNDVN